MRNTRRVFRSTKQDQPLAADPKAQQPKAPTPASLRNQLGRPPCTVECRALITPSKPQLNTMKERELPKERVLPRNALKLTVEQLRCQDKRVVTALSLTGRTSRLTTRQSRLVRETRSSLSPITRSLGVPRVISSSTSSRTGLPPVVQRD